MDKSTLEVKKMYDLGRQYDVIGPWLKENGCTINDLPLSAKNDSGEDVIVEAQIDENGDPIWKITTIQKNEWSRINFYHRDGTVEEMYSK